MNAKIKHPLKGDQLSLLSLVPVPISQAVRGQQKCFHDRELDPAYWDKVRSRCERGICEFCYAENQPGSLVIDRYCQRCFTALTAGQPPGYCPSWWQPRYVGGKKTGESLHRASYFDPKTLTVIPQDSSIEELGSLEVVGSNGRPSQRLFHPDPNVRTNQLKRTAKSKALEVSQAKIEPKDSCICEQCGDSSLSSLVVDRYCVGCFENLTAGSPVGVCRGWLDAGNLWHQPTFYDPETLDVLDITGHTTMLQRSAAKDPNSPSELESESSALLAKDPNRENELGSEYSAVQPHYLVKLELGQTRDCRNFNGHWIGSIECKPIKGRPYYYWRHYVVRDSGKKTRVSPYLGSVWNKALNKLAQLQNKRLSLG
jgi:hypothetical protein